MARTILLRFLLPLVLLVMVAAGVGYWYYLRIFVSTDNAYVSGHVGVVSARVPGRVAQVLVDDNQPVTAGQLLLTLEPQDFEVAVAQAEAALHRLRQDLAAQYARVAAARGKILQARAHLQQALTDQRRYSQLYERRTVPRQTLDQMNTRVKVAQGELAEAQAEERRALAAIGGSTDLPLEEQPAVREAKARLEEARLRLSYTRVKAGVSGYITRRQVKPGNWVQPGQPLMMVVPVFTGSGLGGAQAKDSTRAPVKEAAKHMAHSIFRLMSDALPLLIRESGPRRPRRFCAGTAGDRSSTSGPPSPGP